MKNSFLTILLVSATDGSLDPWNLILQAHWVVKAVMILLIMASLITWTIIFWKFWLLRGASKENSAFTESFWSAGSLEGAMRASKAHPNCSLTRVFESGLHEFNQISNLNLSRDDTIELIETNVTRALDKAVKIENENHKRFVSFLANTASAAPFVGLFGTVWGIMNSFIGIGATGASNLAVVAPGIAEALIATAMGLFAAIPAVLFYNYFTGFIRSVNSSMIHFCTDFLNTAKRSI